MTTLKYRDMHNQTLSVTSLGCGPLDAMNASKHSIDQSKDRILQINQSKNVSKHS